MSLTSTRSMKTLLVACWRGSIVLRQRREGSSPNLLQQTPKHSRDNWKRPRHENETHAFIIHSYVIGVKTFTSGIDNMEWKCGSHAHSSEFAHSPKRAVRTSLSWANTPYAHTLFSKQHNTTQKPLKGCVKGAENADYVNEPACSDIVCLY